MQKLSKKYKYVIFDFDGTINDTSPGIYATFTAVLNHFGVDATGIDLAPHIGPPLDFSYTELLDAQRCAQAIELHCKVFKESNAAQNSHLYDGIVDVLQKLKDSGNYLLAIASSKYEPHAIESLHYHKIRQYFHFVYGQTERRGFKTEVLRQLIDDNGWNRSDCLMIGDTLYDVEGANQNGIDVVAVTYGFGNKQQLANANVVAFAHSPADILALLE